MVWVGDVLYGSTCTIYSDTHATPFTLLTMNSKDHKEFISPFADAKVQQNMSRDINRSSTMIDLKSRTNSMTLDELRNALDGIAEDYGYAFTQRKFKREAGRAWTRNDHKDTSPFETVMQTRLCSEYSADGDVDTEADHVDIPYCNEGGKKTRFWKENNASTLGKKRSIDDV